MLVSFAAVAWLMVRGIDAAAQAESRAQALLLSRSLAASFAVPLARGQHEVIQRQVDQMAEMPDRFPDVARVVVADASGRIIAHSDPSRFGDRWEHAPVTTEQVSIEQPGDLPMFVVALPVETAVRFGTLEVAMVVHGPWAAAHEAVHQVLLALLVAMIGIVAVLSLLLDRLVVRPLRGFAHSVLALHGDRPEHLPVPRGPEEIRTLVEAFNALAGRLGESTSRLEQKVEERTGELQSAYNRLTAANRQLQELAVTDGLTGLANRRAFTDRLALEVDRARRTKAPLSLILFDLDHFKRLNDTLGHLEGDAALVLLAGILREGRRAADLVGRYGGEEFVLLLPDTPHGDALVVAERLRLATETGDLPGHCTVSAGVATLPDQAEDARSLIAASDHALYAAKSAGRNRIAGASGPVAAPAQERA